MAVLFDDTGSAVVALTVTALVSVEPWVSVGSGSTVRVTGTVPPAGTAPRVQTIAAVQEAPAALTKVTPAGSVSLNATPVALDGPVFVTVTVYVYCWPGVTVAGPVLETVMSALGADVVVDAEAELLAATGSAVVAVTEAVSVRVVFCGSEAAAVAVTVNDALAPGASVPTVQVGGDPEQPAAVAPTMPAPGASVSTTPVAVDGPLFVTVIR